jgi:pyridoxine kinase
LTKLVFNLKYWPKRFHEIDSSPTQIWIQFPRLEANFVGTGDLFAALSIAWLDKTGGDLKATLEKVISTMHAILRHTLDHARTRVGPGGQFNSADLELRLIQSRDEILNPEIKFEAVQV